MYREKPSSGAFSSAFVAKYQTATRQLPDICLHMGDRPSALKMHLRSPPIENSAHKRTSMTRHVRPFRQSLLSSDTSFVTKSFPWELDAVILHIQPLISIYPIYGGNAREAL
jgi:hypothetical protein